jgi:putative ABC transport system permease protein
MRDMLYMVWRYLAFHHIKTTLLLLSTALILFLPFGLNALVKQSAESLTRRAETTPLIVGAKGSPLELVLNTLYFESETPPTIPFSQIERITATGLADAIPLYTPFSARGFPIIGTTIDYFEFRNLRCEAGRRMGILGECVIGCEVAEQLNLGVGDTLISSPENVFDLAGVYPLKMEVVGRLEPTGTSDDRIILVDIKTAWIIEGLAHGHQDMARPEATSGILKRENNTIIANASVRQYNEITAENIHSFHFHGDPSRFPITAVVVKPNDQRSATLLQGRYLGEEEPMQIVHPASVIQDLLHTILTVQKYVTAGVIVIGLSTCMTAALVFALSFRLRKSEIETMHRIGGAKHIVAGLLTFEIGVVLLLGAGLAAVLTLLISTLGEEAIRWIII